MRACVRTCVHIRLATWIEPCDIVELRTHTSTEKGIRIATSPSLGGTVEWNLIELSQKAGELARHWDHDGWSNLDLAYTLERRAAYWEQHVILVAVLTVFIAYTSFFITRSAVPARVALTIISFLALSGFVNSVNRSLPHLSDDVWLLSFLKCSLFAVFSAGMEFVLVNYLTRVCFCLC